jgi:hypothetical protein
MAQFPLLLPLLVLFCSPFHFPLTYLETLLWHDAIPSTLAPGCSQTDLPLPIPSPFPPHTLPIPNSQQPRSIVLLTKTTSRARLPRSGTMPGGVLELQHMMSSHLLMTSMARVVGRRQQLDVCLDSLGKS